VLVLVLPLPLVPLVLSDASDAANSHTQKGHLNVVRRAAAEF
jgi:hypothetical protein